MLSRHLNPMDLLKSALRSLRAHPTFTALVILLWFYVSGLAMLIGAELNSVIIEKNDRLVSHDSLTSHPGVTHESVNRPSELPGNAN